jgi:putative MATE family efflux protein
MEPSPSLLGRLRDHDHTRGRLLTSILVLALPSVLTSIGGFGLFQLFDLYFLGELGAGALAAAGATNQVVRQVIFLMILGISVASQMMIARLIGMGNVDGAEHVAGQSLLLGLAIAAGAGLVGGVYPEPILALLTSDPEVVAQGTIYLQIAMVALGTTIGFQLLSGVLNGAGDTTTPMLISLSMTPISILAEWAFAFGELGMPELGIAGIALGAAIGSLAGSSVLFWAIGTGRCRVHLRRRHLLPDWSMLGRILALSWQPAFHMVARTSIVMIFMVLAGRLGGEVQAAYTIGLRIEMFAIMIAFPIANSCATVVGQNLGAGRLDRSWRAIWTGYGIEISVLWPAALGLFWYRTPLVAMFSQDPAVVPLAAEYLAFSSVILAFYGLYFVSFRALQAAGDMNSPMVISISVALLLGSPLGYWLATRTGLGATGMWIANLVYALLNTAITVGWLLGGRWARRAEPGALAEPVRDLARAP